MSNRIDPGHQGIVDKTGSHKVPGSGRGTSAQPGESASSGKTTAKTSLRDTVVLTKRSQLLERLEKTAAQLPEINRARVEAVKADIADGKYRIDADNIADILLRIDKEIGDSS